MRMEMKMKTKTKIKLWLKFRVRTMGSRQETLPQVSPVWFDSIWINEWEKRFIFASRRLSRELTSS